MREFTPEDMVAAARLDLCTNFPFFGSVFLRLNVFEDPTCDTAWTDGVSIGYNIDYCATLSRTQVIGLFVHECLHVILKHHLRQLEDPEFQRQHDRFNRAADYALNPMIKKTDGMDIHPNWLYEPEWEDELVEVIFRQLENRPDLLKGKVGDMPGEVRPWPGMDADGNPSAPGTHDPTQAEIDSAKNIVDQWVRAAGMKAQGAGKMTGHVEQIIKQATATTVNWMDEIQYLAENLCKDDYTWTKPNQSYMSFGVYLPACDGKKAVDMMFFVDTSGSLDDEQLSQICTEIRAILELFWIRVIVVYWDTGFRGVEIFEPEDVLEPEWGLDVKGRGGTQFDDCWDWMEENLEEYDIDPQGIVFFSDLECSDYPEEEPGLPLIWCQVPDCRGSFQHSYLKYLPDYGNHVTVPIYKEA